MTIKEKLMEEFGCAITAIYGDEADKEFDTEETVIYNSDLLAIAKKVAFYLD